MPLLNVENLELPDWSELDNIRIIKLDANSDVKLNTDFEKWALFVTIGDCVVTDEDERYCSEGDEFFGHGNSLKIITKIKSVSVVLVEGKWKNPVGNSGVFRMNISDHPRNIGDEAEYFRNTDFDNHYHDCDEYWIITEGKGIAITENNKFKFQSGDIIATKAGDHHDLPEIHEKIVGVYFETTLKGKQRRGHLWNHTHK